MNLRNIALAVGLLAASGAGFCAEASEDPAPPSLLSRYAANIALFLGRRVFFDPVKCEFINDEEANRLRSEALREPWRI